MVHASAWKEQGLGHLAGPFRRADLPWPKFYPALRFMVDQSAGVDKGSDPYRAVDDLTANGGNYGVTFEEKLDLSNLDMVAALHATLSKVCDSISTEPFHLWKVDMVKAFRQVPLLPEDRPYGVFASRVSSPPSPADAALGLSAGEVVFWEPKALPFGAASAPYLFTRVAHALVEIARKILKIPMQHYLDDFWGLAPKSIAHIHFEAFGRLMTLLGFPTKPEKNLEPTQAGPLLGVWLSFPKGHIAFGTQAARIKSLVQDISEILRADRLSVGFASKLAGRLNFAGSTMTGKLGRAYLYPLYKYASGGGHRYRNFSQTLTQQMRHALEWWRTALSSAPIRAFTPVHKRSIWELWTDAALVPHGVGAVLARSEADPRTPRFRQAIGERGLEAWKNWLPPAEVSERVIYQLELLAVLWAILHWKKQLRGGALRLWIDNEAARFALIGGYSSNPWAARIVSEIWVQLAVHDIFFYVERVPTKENIADGPSRNEYELIERLGIPRKNARPAVGQVSAILETNTALLFGAAKAQKARQSSTP